MDVKTSRILVPCVLAAALAAPTTAASAAGAPSARDGDLLTYSRAEGSVTLLSINDTEAKLPGAPSSFRKFARQSMRDAWQGYYDGRPACKGVPIIQVTALRTDGFAIGNAGDHPRPGCQAGGGYLAFWAIRRGEWKQVIGTQDVPACARLEKLDFPSEVGVHECYDGDDVVPYEHA